MIEFTKSDGKLICTFGERLDTANCTEFQDKLYETIAESKDAAVVFDMQRVDYVASIFLGICIKIYKKKGPENFSLINVRPNVKKVFKITGLDKLININ
jgi:anti-sigma B factor antagonist